MKIHTGNGNWITVNKFGSVNYNPESENWTFNGWELDLNDFHPEDPSKVGISKLAILHVVSMMITLMLNRHKQHEFFFNSK